MLRLALDGEPLERLECLSAAFGGDRRLDEIGRAVLGDSEVDRSGGDEQRCRHAEQVFHWCPPMSCYGGDLNAGPTGREDRGAEGRSRRRGRRRPDFFGQKAERASSQTVRRPARQDHDKLKVDGSAAFGDAALRNRETFRPRDAVCSIRQYQTGVPMSTLRRTMMLAAVLWLAFTPLAFDPVAPTGAAGSSAGRDQTAPVACSATRQPEPRAARHHPRTRQGTQRRRARRRETPMAIGDTVSKDVELHPMPTRVGEKGLAGEEPPVLPQGRRARDRRSQGRHDRRRHQVMMIFPGGAQAAARSRPARRSSATSSSQ